MATAEVLNGSLGQELYKGKRKVEKIGDGHAAKMDCDGDKEVEGPKDGIKDYYVTKIEELQIVVTDKVQNLRRLQVGVDLLSQGIKNVTLLH